MSEEDRYRAGVSIGSGIGGLAGIEKNRWSCTKRGRAASARISCTVA
jgi:hypothetical protein